MELGDEQGVEPFYNMESIKHCGAITYDPAVRSASSAVLATTAHMMAKAVLAAIRVRANIVMRFCRRTRSPVQS